MKSHRSLFLTIVIIMLAGLLMLSSLPAGVHAQRPTPLPTVASTTVISVVPAKTSVSEGEEFDIDINFSSDVPTWGLQMEISYDPKLLEITGVEEGGFYKDWAQANGAEYLMLPKASPDNNTGTIPLFSMVILSGKVGEGPKGDGKLLVLKAKAKGKGNVQIMMSNVQVSDSGTETDTGVFTAEVGGVVLQNAAIAIGSQAAPEQPAAMENPAEATAKAESMSTPEVQPTIERKVPSSGASQTNSVPWEIIFPVAGAVAIGLAVFITTRKKK